MKWEKYEPKTWTEDDIDIEIECCGICGSDLHTLRSGWGETDYPLTVGHEIIGRAIRVGREAEGGFKIGDRFGVGAQAAACLRPDCDECSNGLEHHCENPGNANTFNSRYPDGSKATGGYAEYTRVPSHFVFEIPEEIPSAEAAVMMCAGVTVYAPLVAERAGPGRRVGVIGIGGLGHLALLWAKALDCTEITAISRRSDKKEDALKMGATKFIATDEDKDWSLLTIGGNLIMVGAPEENLPSFNASILLDRKAKIGGSAIGSPKEIREMLDLAVKKEVHPWIHLYAMKDANRAIVEFEEGKPRYRFVLQNDPGMYWELIDSVSSLKLKRPQCP